jgi:hypothetical protein
MRLAISSATSMSKPSNSALLVLEGLRSVPTTFAAGVSAACGADTAGGYDEQDGKCGDKRREPSLVPIPVSGHLSRARNARA